MCGIFGLINTGNQSLKTIDVIERLLLLSESRGTEASGLAILDKLNRTVFKTPYSASRMIKSDIFKQLKKNKIDSSIGQMILGHSRLVTNGYEHFNNNNQPISKHDILTIHNGIIVNEADIWARNTNIKRETQLDTEVIPSIINETLLKVPDVCVALDELFTQINGMTTFAMNLPNSNELVLATNNGSLYYMVSAKRDALIFASERFILKTLISELKISNLFNDDGIIQVNPIEYIIVNMNSIEIKQYKFKEGRKKKYILNRDNIPELVEYYGTYAENHSLNKSLNRRTVSIPKNLTDQYERSNKLIETLTRCKNCLLPSTYPFIEYDKEGVCNYCRHYQKMEISGETELLNMLKKYRNRNFRMADTF